MSSIQEAASSHRLLKIFERKKDEDSQEDIEIVLYDSIEINTNIF
jgi:hypothetical protein